MLDYKNDDLYTDDDGIEFLDENMDSDNVPYDLYTDDTDDDEDFETFWSSSDEEPETKPVSKEKPITILSEIFSFIKIVIIASVIAFLFTTFVIVNAEVPTGSMKNTIMEGDRLIGFRLAYVFDEPQRGDIVIFKFPDDETQNYVKRVIGIPGDVIQITGGHVYVNGELSSEEYIREAMADIETDLTYIVPEDSYFMMGDNRNSSKDSRYWENTFVKSDKILAKVIFRYYDGENNRLNFKFIQ